MEHVIVMQKGELWYGGAIEDGIKMPVGEKDIYSIDLTVNRTYNQASSCFISTFGRYILSEKGFCISFFKGQIKVSDPFGCVRFGETGGGLREAFLAVSCSFDKTNEIPPKEVFTPQYCTWIELLYNQNQKDIEHYAQKIIDCGFPAGILIIDDNWQEDYGVWEFHNRRFPDPKKMMDKLHSLGFKVMLWVVPYVSPDNRIFRENKDLFVHTSKGEIAVREWWNGYSAILDMSNPKTFDFLDEQLNRLMKLYGVDGFKFDGGDPSYLREDDLYFAPSSPNEQSRLWALYAQKYEFNELRSGFNTGGARLVNRLCDKFHSWDTGNGLKSLIPCALQASLLGYTFVCPDMIGGGQYADFAAGKPIDEELFIRSCQASALMPTMQFSFAVWEHLSQNAIKICQNAAELHGKFFKYIYQLALNSLKSSEPILRPMCYSGSEECERALSDQFMLGDKYLVAPVLEKGCTKRTVLFPEGKWIDPYDGHIYGRGVYEIAAPLEKIPYFEKVE